MYSQEKYEHVSRLYKKRVSFTKISKITKIPYQTIYGWIRFKKRPRGYFLKKGFEKLSVELAYIIGVVEGDGYAPLEKSKGAIGLEVSDKDFAKYFKENLQRWSGLRTSFKFNEKKKLFITRLYSIRAVQFLYQFNFYKKIKKAKQNIKIAFVKGFFDSEGGVSGSNLDTPKKATRFIAAYNSNKKLIYFVKSLVEDIGINIQNIDLRNHSGFTNDKTKEYRLRIGGRENLKKFKEKIGFSIKRKNKKLDKVLKSYKT